MRDFIKMKNFNLLSLALLLIVPCAQAAGSPPAGKVVEAQGDVHFAGTNKELKSGDGVSVGDKIATGHSAMARIVLENTAAIEIGPDSEVALEKAPEDKSRWSLNLLTGSLLSAVRKAVGKKSNFEVRSAGTVMGVRGTVFFAQKAAEEPVSLCVCQGTVALEDKHHKAWSTFTSKHHDHQLKIEDKKTSKLDLTKTHSDEQAGKLLELLK